MYILRIFSKGKEIKNIELKDERLVDADKKAEDFVNNFKGSYDEYEIEKVIEEKGKKENEVLKKEKEDELQIQMF